MNLFGTTHESVYYVVYTLVVVLVIRRVVDSQITSFFCRGWQIMLPIGSSYGCELQWELAYTREYNS